MLRTSCYRSSVEKAAKSVRNYGTVTTKTYNSFVRIAPEVGLTILYYLTCGNNYTPVIVTVIVTIIVTVIVNLVVTR